MSSITHKLSSVNFPEYHWVALGYPGQNEFDVIIEEPFSKEKYIISLFNKVFEIGLSEIVPFLDYQCERVKDPASWLNGLEKTIKFHASNFNNPDLVHRHHKLMAEIAVKRRDLKNVSLVNYRQKMLRKNINGFSEEKEYCFDTVKQEIYTIELVEEKISYLQEQIFDYRQEAPDFVRQNAIPFDKLCELEIEKIEKKEELRLKAEMRQQSSPSPRPAKLRINCNLNVFVDILYQLMHEIKVNDLPVLDATNTQVANMISLSFLDKNGKEISVKSVQTILEVNRPEKRPKGDKRIKLHIPL